MTVYNSLFLSPQWLQEYHTKYPHGLSVMENLIEWVNQVNELIDYVNITPDKVQTILDAMETDGRLGTLINNTLFTTKADKVDLESRGLNAKFGLYPAAGDGVTDDTTALQNILDLAALTKLPVILPAGVYKITSPITIPEGVKLKGVGRMPWLSDEGSVILSSITDGSDSLIISRSASVSDLAVRGSSLCNGIGTAVEAYDMFIQNVIVKSCQIGFNITDSWTYEMKKCRTENCKIGFNVLSGTSAVFSACVAFNAAIAGFIVNGVTYTNFIGCGSDGCLIGIDLPGTARGVTFASFGLERISGTGIKVTNDNTAATFTALNVGTNQTVDIIEMSAGSITITDFRLSSVMAPISPKKIINKTGGTLTLINPMLFGNIGDIEECFVIGGNQTNRIDRALVANKISSLDGVTGSLDALTGESAVLSAIPAGSTYIASAMVDGSGAQNCQQIIRSDATQTNNIVTDMTAKDAVEFFFSGNDIKIRNLSSSVKSYKWSLTRIR